MKIIRWQPDDIGIPNRIRKRINKDAVRELMGSIQRIGLREPPTVRIEVDEEGFQHAILVAGLHRVEACKRLGVKVIDCFEFKGSETEARLWEIAENLHRAELTELEWSEHVAEWKRLAEQKGAEGVSGQNVQKLSSRGRSGEGRPEGGTAKAARELPIPGPTEEAKRKRVERAVKIAGIAPEAKAAAAAAGLANS
jgi:ParB-like chromosome segregation protein Spo0J